MICIFCFNRMVIKQDNLKKLLTIPETWGKRQETDRQTVDGDRTLYHHSFAFPAPTFILMSLAYFSSSFLMSALNILETLRTSCFHSMGWKL